MSTQQQRKAESAAAAPDYEATEEQGRITSIAVAQRGRMMQGVTQAMPLADPDETYKFQVAVHQEAKKRGIVSMGALGDVKRVISAIPRELIMPNPLHPRDNWRDLDDSMRQLCHVLEQIGQPQRLVATTIDPRDPSATKYRVALIDGHRIWRAAEINNGPSTLDVEVLEHGDGRPLSQSEILEWYLLGNLMYKPLTMEQLVRGYASYAEVAEREGKRVDLSPTDLAQRHHLSKSTTARVVGILNEPEEIRHAISAKVVQVRLVIQLWTLIPDQSLRLKCLQHIIAVNGEREHQQRPRLTIDEAMAEARKLSGQPAHLALPPAQTETTNYISLLRRHQPQASHMQQSAAAALDMITQYLLGANREIAPGAETLYADLLGNLAYSDLVIRAHEIMRQAVGADVLDLVHSPIVELLSSSVVEAD